MRVSLDEQLAALATLSLAQLRTRWTEVSDGPVPRVSAALLRLAIAYTLQERAHGGLSRRASQRLEQIAVSPSAVAEQLGMDATSGTPEMRLVTSVRLTRTGRVVQLVQDNGCAATAAPVDEKLLRLIARARSWWCTLLAGEMTIDKLAAQEGVTASWMTRVVRLAFLSPAVVEAILTGRTKAGVDAASLTATGGVPVGWRAQAKLYLAQAA